MVSTKWALTVIIMIIVIISLHRHHLHHHYQLEYFCLLPFSLMPVRGPIKFPAMPVSLRLTISFNRWATVLAIYCLLTNYPPNFPTLNNKHLSSQVILLDRESKSKTGFEKCSHALSCWLWAVDIFLSYSSLSLK